MLSKFCPNSKINGLLEKYKETDLVKALKNLFCALDKNGSVDKKCIMESFECVDRYMGIFGHETECIELRQFLKEGLNKEIECHTIESSVSGDILSEINSIIICDNMSMFSICVNSNANFLKLNCEEIKRIVPAYGNFIYYLKAIFICDEENCCFTTAYVKHKDGKWYKHSVDGIEGELLDDNSIIFMLKNYHGKVNLLYEKSNEQVSW